MSDVRHARDDALDRVQFLDLYRAATRISDEYKRDVAIIALLCAARLKMRIGEIMHLHEGWIDWSNGTIRIPQFEPCGCKYCWKRSQENFDSSEESEEDENEVEDGPEDFVEYHYTNRWQPKSEKGSRTVPFNWSFRIVKAFEYFFDKHEVIDEDYQWCRRLLNNHILPNAEHLEKGEVKWNGLRATGETFWADADIQDKARRDLAGRQRISDSIPYEAQSPVQLSNKMRRAVGKDPLRFQTADFVSLDPRPFEQEPFDPRNPNPRRHHDPFSKGPQINPRTPNPPDGVEFEPSRFDSLAVERNMPTPSERRALVRRVEAERKGDPENVDVTDPYLAAAMNPPEDEPVPGQARLTELNIFQEGETNSSPAGDSDEATDVLISAFPVQVFQVYQSVVDRIDQVVIRTFKTQIGYRPLDPMARTQVRKLGVGVLLIMSLMTVMIGTGVASELIRTDSLSITMSRLEMWAVSIGIVGFLYSLLR